MARQFNLQIQVRDETKELFKQTFVGSGLDSQGAFLRELLDNYLSEDNVRTIEKPVDNPELIVKLEDAEAQLQEAFNQLQIFTNHPVIVALYDKNKGKTFKFTDNNNKKREVKVETIIDVFEIIMSKTYSE